MLFFFFHGKVKITGCLLIIRVWIIVVDVNQMDPIVGNLFLSEYEEMRVLLAQQTPMDAVASIVVVTARDRKTTRCQIRDCRRRCCCRRR